RIHQARISPQGLLRVRVHPPGGQRRREAPSVGAFLDQTRSSSPFLRSKRKAQPRQTRATCETYWPQAGQGFPPLAFRKAFMRWRALRLDISHPNPTPASKNVIADIITMSIDPPSEIRTALPTSAVNDEACALARGHRKRG